MEVPEERIRQIENRLAGLESAGKIIIPHAASHELPGLDTVRPAIQNSGTLLNRYPITNFAHGVTASESSANKRIDVDVALTSYKAASSDNILLTTSYQDITGATVTLANIGTYIVIGIFYFGGTAAAGGTSSLIGALQWSSTTESIFAVYRVPAALTSTGTVAQVWTITTTEADTVAKLKAYKTVDEGTFYAYAGYTTITAFRTA